MSKPDTTALALFFDSPADAAAQLGRAVRSGAVADEIGGALGRMPDAGKNAVLAEVATVTAGILDLDLTDIFAQSWGKYEALRDAATASLADPDGEELVELVTHKASFDYEPAVEIHVADFPVATVSVRIEIEATVRGLIAVVRNGRLTAVRAGNAELNGVLSILGQHVTDGATTFDLPAVIRLGAGIPLASRGEGGSPPGSRRHGRSR